MKNYPQFFWSGSAVYIIELLTVYFIQLKFEQNKQILMGKREHLDRSLRPIRYLLIAGIFYVNN